MVERRLCGIGRVCNGLNVLFTSFSLKKKSDFNHERNGCMEINGAKVQETYYYKDMGLSEATMKALDKKGFTQATQIGRASCRERV